MQVVTARGENKVQPYTRTRLFDWYVDVDTGKRIAAIIPQTHKHLEIQYMLRGTSASNQVITMLINNDSSASYSHQTERAANTTLVAAETLATTYARIGRLGGTGAPSGSYALGNVYIPNYAQASLYNIHGHYKCAARTGTTTGLTTIDSGAFHWWGGDAVRELDFLPDGGAFAVGSRITIYGIT